MLSCPVLTNRIRLPTPSGAVFPFKNRRAYFPFPSQSLSTTRNDVSLEEKGNNQKLSGVHYDTLKVLEWDKVCNLVASFASTPPGRDATKAHLWDLQRSYEDSLKLLEETNAAVEMHKHGGCRLAFTGLQLHLVTLAVQNARRGLPVGSNEAIAVAVMLELVEVMRLNLKAAVKEDADWYNRFMPLSQVIMELVTNRLLVRTIRQVVDEDGFVKDSASLALKRSRDQVRILEKKLSQLIDSIIRREMRGTSFLEVSIVNGRWCIRSGTGRLMGFKCLLLSSDSGKGSILEPLVAVPLNDELQQARASVAKAETDVLLMLTEKMQKDLGDIEKASKNIIQLDVINARATYSVSFGGSCPALYMPEEVHESSTANALIPGKKNLQVSSLEWLLCMPKAYHPLLLQQYRLNLRKAQKAGNKAATASALGVTRPIPVDFLIAWKTKVLVITGPNTGGKTICLKTIGLAAIMAKSGLYVLSSESIQIPWFDSIFADIGDEQSLSQSLSTFSGHLRQISNIQSESTSQSLVLLDEVGAGTNPLEGAALGMALLESFANSGALLTIATAHHGELKSLKYSNDAFENACMEFDESSLRPTYKILWGIPGRSNAINISERLGLPDSVICHARELYGATSAELNEVIVDMERFKQNFQELIYESQDYLMMSRKLYEKLLCARRKILDHSAAQRNRKTRKLYEIASVARSTLHKTAQELRASATHNSRDIKDDGRQFATGHNQLSVSDKNGHSTIRSSSSEEIRRQSPSVMRTKFPKVGDVVQVSSLGTKGTVLRVDLSKDEVLVQAGVMKLKVKLCEIFGLNGTNETGACQL